MVLFKQLLIYTRLIIITLGKSPCNDLRKVTVTYIILCKENQMEVSLIIRCSLLIKAASRSYINLASDNRLYALLLAFFIKIYNTVHDTVVCNGQTVESQLLCPCNKKRDLGSTVQKTVLGMYMQMCKFISVH